MVLAMAICETCPPGDVEIMISVLLNLFDTRTSLVNLLKLMIDREITHTGPYTISNEDALCLGHFPHVRERVLALPRQLNFH
jgi:hypothetical protein